MSKDKKTKQKREQKQKNENAPKKSVRPEAPNPTKPTGAMEMSLTADRIASILSMLEKPAKPTKRKTTET